MPVMILAVLAALAPVGSKLPSTPPAPPPAYIDRPVYEQEPGFDDFDRTFPERAYKEGVTLKGDIDCKVTAEGRMVGCTVNTTGPQGYGFEAAALEVAKTLKLAPLDGDGAPVAGRRSRYWLRYEPPALGSTADPRYRQVAACTGLALARAEAGPDTEATRTAATGWLNLYLNLALNAGLSPAQANQNLDKLRLEAEARIAAGKVAAGEDDRCWTDLRDGPPGG